MYKNFSEMFEDLVNVSDDSDEGAAEETMDIGGYSFLHLMFRCIFILSQESDQNAITSSLRSYRLSVSAKCLS